MIDLEEGEVRCGVRANHSRGDGLATVHDDSNGDGLVDDVVAGDDVTIARNEKARALRLHVSVWRLRITRRPPCGRERLVEGRALEAVAFGVGRNDDGDNSWPDL